MEKICEWCGKSFKRRDTLLRHQKTANGCIKIQTEINTSKCSYCNQMIDQRTFQTHVKYCLESLYKSQFEEIDLLKNTCRQYENRCAELEIKVEKFRLRVESATEQILKDGNTILKQANKIESLEETIEDYRDKLIAKSTTVIHNHNNKNKTINTGTDNTKIYYNSPKLKNICINTIQPFTTDLIEENLAKYTKEKFLKTEAGLRDFLHPLMILEYDGITERNFACTDSSRCNYYRLKEDKNWISDAKARYLVDIFKCMEPTVRDYYSDAYKNSKDYGSDKMEKLAKFMTNISHTGEEQDKLIKRFLDNSDCLNV